MTNTFLGIIIAGFDIETCQSKEESDSIIFLFKKNNYNYQFYISREDLLNSLMVESDICKETMEKFKDVGVCL